MTIYAFEAQESWLPTVVGSICRAVEIDDETLHLHFGTTQPDEDGVLTAERSISMHGVWRVEKEGDVVAGSGDLDVADIVSRLAVLSGAGLERYEISRPGFDLDLYFTGQLIVRAFPCDSREYAEDDDIDAEADLTVSWWVDGDGIPDDWEEHYAPAGS